MRYPRPWATARGAASLALALLAVGCATRTEYVPFEVKVPVEVPCSAPQEVVEPVYETSLLVKNDELDTKVKALLVERQQRAEYAKKLKAAVEGCK